MYAYNKTYLDDARRNIGGMFDYAINVYGMDADEFWDIFAPSKVARGLAVGNPKYIAGMSGCELFAQLIHDTHLKWIELKDVFRPDRSREYWAGFALALYQWQSGDTYAVIRNKGIMLSDIVDMYILHEAPDEKFIEMITARISENHEANMLKRLRKYAGLTQKGLSEASGVSLRMIQLYEQGQNDLSRAQAKVVVSLAKALGCDAEELI